MATVAVKQDRNNKTLAAIITIGIHALLLLFFILYIIITPIPPYPEPPGGGELELDFGNGVNGTGNVEANNMGNNTSSVSKAVQTSQPTPKATNPVVTNNVESAPVVSGSKTTTTQVKVDTVKPQPQMSVQLASSLNKFKNSKGQSGGNGNSGQQGNAGSPNGVLPGTSTGNGVGPGPGGGGNGSPDFKLSGRQLVHRPNFVTNNPVQGQIVVGITVDGDGTVTEATPGVIGTTINDGTLYKMVQDAALKTKFNKSPDGTPEQYGTITFRFTIQ